MSLNESIVEDTGLEWFGELSYAVGHGPHLTHCEPATEHHLIGKVVLMEQWCESLLLKLQGGVLSSARIREVARA
ncbi:MAG: hypothetical protein EBS05_12470 [Proteobacteria bacterium]|nr:hypothetical protein [Pseudomonadota bacterium]